MQEQSDHNSQVNKVVQEQLGASVDDLSSDPETTSSSSSVEGGPTHSAKLCVRRGGTVSGNT